MTKENRRNDGSMEMGNSGKMDFNSNDALTNGQEISNYFENMGDYMLDQNGTRYDYNAETDSYECQLDGYSQSDSDGVCVSASDGASVDFTPGGLIQGYHSFRKSDLNKTIRIKTAVEKIEEKERNKVYNDFVSEDEKYFISETTFGIIVGVISTLMILGIISLISKSFANGITSFFEPKLLKWIVDSISSLF